MVTIHALMLNSCYGPDKSDCTEIPSAKHMPVELVRQREGSGNGCDLRVVPVALW